MLYLLSQSRMIWGYEKYGGGSGSSEFPSALWGNRWEEFHGGTFAYGGNSGEDSF